MWLQLYLSKGGLFLHPLMWAGLATCFVQWDISKCDTSTSLQSACTWKFALSCCSWNLKPPCKHVNKPELAWQMVKGTCPVTVTGPTPKDSHLLTGHWLKAPEWAQLRPSGPSSWAQPRLQAPELGTNEMDVALFKPPNLGCFASQKKLTCIPSSLFFLFLSIYPSSPPFPPNASCFLFVLLQ